MTIVLVEGESDRAALTTLARRLGRDLARDGVVIVPMGGATKVPAFVRRRHATRIVGLCDSREAILFRMAAERAGVEVAALHVCVDDLEDELIRALGADVVQLVVEAQGELRSFRTLQKQPAQRDRTIEAQLRRFIGCKSGRKLRMAEALVDALDLEHVPAPLAAALTL